VAPFGEVSRCAVGVFFVASAVLKVVAPASVHESLDAFHLTSVWRTPLVVALPAVEITIGGLLVFTGGKVGLIIGGGSVALFSVFLGLLTLRAPGVRCGCLGDLGSGDHALGLVRNLILALLVILAWSSTSAAPGPLAVIGGVEIAFAVAVLSEGIYVLKGLRVASFESRSASE
jgi:putative oxidoreductase